MTIRTLTAAMLIAIFAIAGVQAASSPAHYAVLIDLSQSNPLIADSNHAARVSNDVNERMAAAALGDRVTIATFGEYDVKKNRVLEKDLDIYFRPDAARQSARALISDIPAAIGRGDIKSQGRTNIVAALSMIARRLDCSAYKGIVFALTDGQENSGHGQMPELPREAAFKDCESFLIIGIHGRDGRHTDALARAWMDWCAASGFRRCDYLE